MQSQHRRQFPLLTSAKVASRIGSYRDPNTPPNLPTRPGPGIRQRVATWEMQPLGHPKRLSGTYVPEREQDEIESPRSHRFPGSRPSTTTAPPQTPATPLRGGFEKEVGEVINISNLLRDPMQSSLHQLQCFQIDLVNPTSLPIRNLPPGSAAFLLRWLNLSTWWKTLSR